MKHPIALTLAMVSLTIGCMQQQAPALTPLEIQSLQSREFETNKEVVFASVMTVFQDLGYVIQSADKDTGFITANSPTKSTGGFFANAGGSRQQTHTKATAFIEQIREGLSKARLNFVRSTQTSTEQGLTSTNEKPLLDGLLYQNAFDRIGEAVFVRTAIQ